MTNGHSYGDDKICGRENCNFWNTHKAKMRSLPSDSRWVGVSFKSVLEDQ